MIIQKQNFFLYANYNITFKVSYAMMIFDRRYALSFVNLINFTSATYPSGLPKLVATLFSKERST